MNQILDLKFINRENIYLKSLLLLRYFFKVGLNYILVYFLKDVNIYNVLV